MNVRTVSVRSMFAAAAVALCTVCLAQTKSGESPAPTAFDQYLEDAWGSVRALQSAFGEKVSERSAEVQSEVDATIADFLGVDAAEHWLQRMQRAQHVVPANAHDAKGIAAFARHELDQAIIHFEASIAANNSGGFPHLFAGLVRFDQGDFAKAARHFRAAADDDHCKRVAVLMAHLCTRCIDSPPQDDAALWAHFIVAHHEATGELFDGEFPEPKSLFALSPYTDEMALHKAKAIVVEHHLVPMTERLLIEFKQTDDPDRTAAIGLHLAGRNTKHVLFAALAVRFPDDKRLPIASFYQKWTSDRGQREQLEQWDAFMADLARVAQLEPNNGAFTLWQIKPLFETPDDSSWVAPPLTDAERRILADAANAPQFNTYAGVFMSEQERMYEQLHGPFALAAYYPTMTYGGSLYRQLMRRSVETLTELLEAGRNDEADKLINDLLVLADRRAAGDPSTMRYLLWASYRGLVYGTVYKYERKHETAPRTTKMIAEYEEAIRAPRSLQLVLNEMLAVGEIPSWRLRRISNTLLATDDDGRRMRESGRRAKEALLGDELLNDLHVERLADLLDRPDELHSSYFYTIVALGDSGRADALPYLRPLTELADPVTKLLATRAIERIEAAQRASE